ncbi:MAG: Pantothenate precursors transporter PanS [Alphaproteobacteria bacterium MarineAlpha11_Bin1]|nr:MAG: Pantothenate precursors transporter PanS [Alphaproteobacteria bacterium MarineAlpha11_Bin1]|tara:strand:+ start:4638 stop:5498 length:861 start_codon:yes stop_codon:yes gene_type:complete
MGIIAELFLPLALAFIMFALGLRLALKDFSRVFKQPKDFLVGAISQLILLPVIAFALVSIWPLHPEIALGVMIIAVAPGGVTSNILTSFARGDVALSISLTAVISLVCLITIPLVLVFAHGELIGGNVGDVSITKTAVSVFLIVTVPTLIGLFVRHYAERFTQVFEPWAHRISTALFVIVLLGAILQQRENIIPFFAEAGLITLVLNILMMVLAYTIARAFASGPPQRAAISIECGLQNGTLAIAISTILFGGGLTAIPAATYSLIMFFTALILILLIRSRKIIDQ